MPALSDVKFDALRGLGYTGSISDMLLQYLQAAPFGGVIGEVPKAIPDAWQAALVAANTAVEFTTADYHRSDWWFEYLGSLGYEGQINDRELAYWTDLLPPPVDVNNFGPGFGPGFEK